MLWERLADLPLAIDAYSIERLERGERVTYLLRLRGGGTDGLGEEISGERPPEALDLAGEWTLASFCDALAEIDLWPDDPPEWALARNWRNWTFESAALDLALRQAGTSLAAALGRTARPLRFVNSLPLADPPSAEQIATRRAANPTVGFKLDAAVGWDATICAELAALGAVETVDFKGRYGLDEPEGLDALYERVLAAFTEARFEDPHERLQALIPPDRLSLDAPIVRAADIGSTPTINVKPSRIGAIRPLLEIYEHCEAHGVAMYGGGMGELDIGRRQIQLLASLFHPDGPNDVAPTPFNDPTPPPGLPASPLTVDAATPGFATRSSPGGPTPR